MELAKVIIYFTLMLALVTTPERLRALIAVVTLCIMVSAAIGILHFKGVMSVPVLEIKGEEVLNTATMEYERIRRLRFTGLLQDPNEVAVFLSVLSFLCTYQWQSRSYGFLRHLWLIPLAAFMAAIAFTMSRGGLLAFLVGMAVFAVYRFPSVQRIQIGPGRYLEKLSPGGGRAVGFLLAMTTLALLGFGGRQANIDAKDGSAQGRIELWSDWMMEFRYHPVLGVSPSVSTQTAEADPGEGAKPKGNVKNANTDHLAHNSFIQAFADLGILGGICFLGMFLWGFATLNRYAFGKTQILDPEQKRLQPYLIAAIDGVHGRNADAVDQLPDHDDVRAGAAGGLLRDDAVLSKLVSPPPPGRKGHRPVSCSAIGFLAFMYVFVRVFRNF